MRTASAVLFCFYTLSVIAQDTLPIEEYIKQRGEAVIAFPCPSYLSLEELSKIVSIDIVQGSEVRAYVNKHQFERFRTLGVPFRVLMPPSLLFVPKLQLKSTSGDIWNHYPTYAEYLHFMQYTASAFPSITRLDTIGYSAKGKLLLALKISDSAAIDQPEPRVFLTSSIHGDELTGYVLMLNLIDTLLSGYAISPRIKLLIDHLEIYINPLANPDGTYRMSDTSVYGSTRYNSNSVDLNRNFPDPSAGSHPDGETWQPETQAMMQFMEKTHFALSANFHGGAEVVNYPWDTWQERHPDDAWFHNIGKRYADSAHKYGQPGYFTYPFSSGVTNGYDWYSIKGGRQDYVTWFLRGREFTIEVSTIKIPDESDLSLYWKGNHSALLGFLEEALRGIQGFITDSMTRKPLKALISLVGHDMVLANSAIQSDSLTGYFIRLLQPDEYLLKFEAAGYKAKTVPVNLPPDSLVTIRITMVQDTSGTSGNILLGGPDFEIMKIPVSDILPVQFLSATEGQVRLRVSDLEGKIRWEGLYDPLFNGNIIEINVAFLSSGFYFIIATDRRGTTNRKFIVLRP